MSYNTGTLVDFENRMHQGAVDSSTLSSYISEGNNYLSSGTGVVWMQISGKWEKEARLCSFRFTQSVNDLNTQMFGAGPGAPQGLAISSGSTTGNVLLSWATGAPPTATGYELWRSVDGGSFGLYQTQTGLNYADASGLSPTTGRYQTYEVRAFNSSGTGSFSSTRSIGNTLPNNNSVSTINYADMAVVFNNFDSTSNSNLITVSAPVLLRIGGRINLSNNSNMTSVSMPSLGLVGGPIFLGGSSNLATATFTNLISTAGDLQIHDAVKLNFISFPLLVKIGGHATMYGATIATGVNLPNLALVVGGRLDFNNNIALPNLSLPALTGIDNDFNFSFCNILTGVSAPVLSNIGGTFIFNDNPLIQSISLPVVTSLGVGMQGSSCSILKFISLTGVTNVGGDVDISNNSQLTGFNLPNAVYIDGVLFNGAGNALTSTIVNQILARFVASSTTSCTIDLSGGTNGAPTGQGVTDKITLIGSGNVVTTN